MHYIFNKYLQKADYALDTATFLMAIIVLIASALIATGTSWSFSFSSLIVWLFILTISFVLIFPTVAFTWSDQHM